MGSPLPPGAPDGRRRGNGLQAADWGALVDVDPRLAEGLLDRLAAAAVPAYVEPASATDPFSRAPLPNRPLDRLWVDPQHADQARAVVAAEVSDLSALLAESEPGATAHGLVQAVPRHAARRVLSPPPLPGPPFPRRPQPPSGQPPEQQAGGQQPPSGQQPPASEEPEPFAGASRDVAPGAADGTGGAVPLDPPPAEQPLPLDEDELFRQIVAGFDRPSEDPVPRWPVSEDDGPPAEARRRPPPVDRAPRPPRRRRDDDALPGWVEPDAIDDPTLDTGGYVPPPPPPAPRVQPRTLAAVGVLLLGLVLVFVPQLLGRSSTPGSLMLGAALMIGGAGALVWWMRDSPPPDGGPGDGAVV